MILEELILQEQEYKKKSACADEGHWIRLGCHQDRLLLIRGYIYSDLSNLKNQGLKIGYLDINPGILSFK